MIEVGENTLVILRILENYNKVLMVSSSLLDSFFKGNLLTISGEILNSLGKER